MAATLGGGQAALRLKQDYFCHEKTNSMLGNSEIATREHMIRMVLNFQTVTTSSSCNDLTELQRQNMVHQHRIQNQTIICVQLYFVTKLLDRKWN